jgi:hypothetical protein
LAATLCSFSTEDNDAPVYEGGQRVKGMAAARLARSRQEKYGTGEKRGTVGDGALFNPVEEE